RNLHALSSTVALAIPTSGVVPLVDSYGIPDMGCIASPSLLDLHPGLATTHIVEQVTSSWQCLDGLRVVRLPLYCAIWEAPPLCFPLTGSHLQCSSQVSGDGMVACHWYLVIHQANDAG
ncbi:MAG: hypothetical protein MPL62_18005, partial [Alphaproteobacteria bacterium]|nr:hypothetical protein [Alphaproteobacteria bacterium]